MEDDLVERRRRVPNTLGSWERCQLPGRRQVEREGVPSWRADGYVCGTQEEPIGLLDEGLRQRKKRTPLSKSNA